MDCPSTLFGGTMGCVAQTETQTGSTITAITANVLNPEDTSKLICFPSVPAAISCGKELDYCCDEGWQDWCCN